ncbi:hypothetical protein BDN70DRAFT_901273 [Pholiota conissans]|uniref:Uncharacterized protein n=1 Tax=Pholiota conissans TaxID=109636 RepID=A0A9P5YMG8_9AGAR|nr:hypothetical protein BDN70DRAFT_901273 [Pholiota conissans]
MGLKNPIIFLPIFPAFSSPKIPARRELQQKRCPEHHLLRCLYMLGNVFDPRCALTARHSKRTTTPPLPAPPAYKSPQRALGQNLVWMYDPSYKAVVVAETMVHDGQMVYTGYYVRKGIDGRVVFISIGRLQSLHVNCLECLEWNAWFAKNKHCRQRVLRNVYWDYVYLSTILLRTLFGRIKNHHFNYSFQDLPRNATFHTFYGAEQ